MTITTDSHIKIVDPIDLNDFVHSFACQIMHLPIQLMVLSGFIFFGVLLVSFKFVQKMNKCKSQSNMRLSDKSTRKFIAYEMRIFHIFFLFCNASFDALLVISHFC